VPGVCSMRTASPAPARPASTCRCLAASTLSSSVTTTLFSTGSIAHAVPGTLAATLIVCSMSLELALAVLDDLRDAAGRLDLLGGALVGDVDDDLVAVDVAAGGVGAEGFLERLGLRGREAGGLGGAGGGQAERGGGGEHGDELHGGQLTKRR
jgi:hypothetical protein